MIARIRNEAARRLLAAAITLQSAHRSDLSVGNPSPHRQPAPRGDYPRLRTGGGRANVAVAPASVAGVLSAGYVAVGYRPGGVHLAYLGNKGWKWIADTYVREGARLAAILQGNGTP